MSTAIPPPGPIEHDDEGDPVPQPADASDLRDLIQLMEWARRKGFVVGPMVRVGKVAVQITDARQVEGKPRPPGDEETRPSIWEEHGFAPNKPQDE